MHELRDTVHAAGRVSWIGIAAETRGPIEAVDEVQIEVGTGIAGEHHARSGRGERQVTLVQKEHLPVIAGLCGRESVEPALLRRNILVEGINLRVLERRRFRIGEALLEGSGPCAPCSRMEQNLGTGGYQATRGHSGITATVIEAGRVRVGDAVTAEPLLE